MDRRLPESDKSRRIIRAARELLREDPYSSLAVRKVAERAGIGATTLRNYFPTQRSLRDALMTESFSMPVDDMRIDDESVPAEDRLEECLRQLLPPGTRGWSAMKGWVDTITQTFGSAGSSSARLAWEGRVAVHQAAVMRWLERIAHERPLPHLRHRALLLLVCLDGLAVSRLTVSLLADEEEESAILRAAIRSALAEAF